MLFAQLPGVATEQADLTRVRRFVGDGTEFLKVPGLVKVESVRVGPIELPRTEVFTYPLSGQKGHFIDTQLPVYDVQKDAEGTPILLRAEYSNDGKWQSGVEIYVTGDWEQTPGSDGTGSVRTGESSVDPVITTPSASFAGVTATETGPDTANRTATGSNAVGARANSRGN